MKVQITLSAEEAFAIARQQMAEKHGCDTSCVVVEPLPFSSQAVHAYPKDANENVEKLIVMLAGGGFDKIGCIKAIRALTGMGLKDAKDLIESRWGEGRVTHADTRKILRETLNYLKTGNFISENEVGFAYNFVKTHFNLWL